MRDAAHFARKLDEFQRRGEGRLPGLVGFRPLAVGEARLEAELDIRPNLLAPNGYLHAATVIALADTACGYGCLAHLPDDGHNFTTIELKSNFLSTARDGTLTCVATATHLGRTTHVWDATVTRKADGATIALFRCTQMVLPPRGRPAP
jgi:uncharacterized protein (TIGR00369 family)